MKFLTPITLVITICMLVFALLIKPDAIHAQSGGSVIVGAQIDSKVSNSKSYITLSSNETLADPENHPILMTVCLLDDLSNPMPAIPVEINSSRGTIDIIELFDIDGQTLLPVNEGVTDTNGMIKFRLSSYIPGEAVFTTLADTLVYLEPQNIKFTALPFPGNVQVSVTLPKILGGGSYVIIPAASDTPDTLSQGSSSTSGASGTTVLRSKAREVADVGTELNIPFWLFSALILFMVIVPLLIIIIIVYSIKIRKGEKRELELLEKIAKAEHIDEGGDVLHSLKI